MIDTYIFGKVNRISPEAPIPIIEITNKEDRIGGAGNVALNIKSLGAIPILCGIIGIDIKGNRLKEILKENKMTDKAILESKNRITTCKTRIISAGQHLLRVDEETSEYINEEIENKFLDKIKSTIENHDIKAIILEDYNKGVLSPKIIRNIISTAREKNIITTVDPKKTNFFEYKNVDIFKPNLKELSEGIKFDLKNDDIQTIKREAQKLRQKINAKIVLITLSENGILICSENKEIHLPTKKRTISDVSGAGDTVISIATLSYLFSNEDITILAKISNTAGGIVCEETGVVPINKNKLLNEILNS